MKAARTLATRFVDAFGEPVNSPFASLTRAFPLPSRVVQLRAMTSVVSALSALVLKR